MPIRAAEVSDAAALLAIYRPYVIETPISFEIEPPTEAEFADRIRNGLQQNPWLVFEQNGLVAGFAYASAFRARAAYALTRETTVYVAREAHGGGIGRQLMDELIARLRSDGIRLAVAGITLPNEASVGLHERLGFTPVGVFHGAGHKFGVDHDLGFWELRIPAPHGAGGEG